MSSDFDPYRVWLSIPANEQPANYYRLLGVELFESDDEVISSAADRQMTHVRTFQSGEYSELAQKILKELATAQVTLLNKTKKVKYDAQLRSKFNSSSDPKIDDTIVVELPPPPPQPLSSNKSEVKHKKKKAVKTVTKNSSASLTPFIVVLLFAMVLELFIFISFFLFYLSKQPSSAGVYQRKAKGLYDQSIELEKEKKYPEALSKLNAVCELVPENEDYKSAQQRVQEVVEEMQLFAGARKTFSVNGVEFAFRWCPPGSFMMGSPESEEERLNDETYHQVTLTKGFWMMETEVTQKQWKAVMGSESASHFKGDDLPVESVSLADCQNFCQKSSELGLPLQLPTESQWEYACRAGTKGTYSGNLDDIAWYGANSNNITHPVGMKKPNAWGLLDMTGNVWERCRDLRSQYSSKSVTDPEETLNGSYRAVRGGGLFSRPSYCRSACRGDDGPGCREHGLGFRCIKGQ